PCFSNPGGMGTVCAPSRTGAACPAPAMVVWTPHAGAVPKAQPLAERRQELGAHRRAHTRNGGDHRDHDRHEPRWRIGKDGAQRRPSLPISPETALLKETLCKEGETGRRG